MLKQLFIITSFAALVANSMASDFKSSFKVKLVEGIQQVLSKRMKLPAESFQINLSGLHYRPQPMKTLENKKITSIEVLGLDNATAQRYDGFANFPVILHSEVGEFEFKVQAIVRVIGPVYIAGQHIARDQVTTEQSFRLSSMPWKQLPTGVATFSIKELIGKRASRFIQAGAAIHPSTLELPYDVKNGESVDLLVLSGPGVMISSRAIAKESGKIGEIIRLLQPATKKSIKAVVVGKRKVEVRL